MVPGEQISANTKCSSSQAAVVPLGERLGVPSGQTVAMKPNCCSSTVRRMSSVRMPIELLSSLYQRAQSGQKSPVLSERLPLEDFITLGKLDPRLLPAGPYVPRGPQPRCIVQRASPDADYA